MWNKYRYLQIIIRRVTMKIHSSNWFKNVTFYWKVIIIGIDSNSPFICNVFLSSKDIIWTFNYNMHWNIEEKTNYYKLFDNVLTKKFLFVQTGYCKTFQLSKPCLVSPIHIKNCRRGFSFFWARTPSITKKTLSRKLASEEMRTQKNMLEY